MWWQPLVRVSLATLTVDSAKVAYGVGGFKDGRGIIATWRTKYSQDLASYAAWLLVRWYVEHDYPAKAHPRARRLFSDGLRDPRLADYYAGLLSAPGRAEDLKAARDVCRVALQHRGENSDRAWLRVLTRLNAVEGRLARLEISYTDLVDEDGDPVPKRRHAPTQPRRLHRALSPGLPDIGAARNGKP